MAIQVFTSILDGTCVDKAIRAIRLSAKLWQSKRTRLSWISWAQETTQTETLDNLGRRRWQNRVHPKWFSWVWTQRASPGHIFVGWSIFRARTAYRHRPWCEPLNACVFSWALGIFWVSPRVFGDLGWFKGTYHFKTAAEASCDCNMVQRLRSQRCE